VVRLSAEHGLTVVFVTHSVYESVYLSNRVIVMAARPGRVAADLAVRRPGRATATSATAPPSPRRPAASPRPSEERSMTLPSTIEGAPQDEPAPVNLEQARQERRDRWLSVAMPVAAVVLAIGGWEALVRINEIPPYIIPAPSVIAATLWTDGPSLLQSAWFTVKLTFFSLVLAILGGVLLGALFALSRNVERSLFPLR
jgi:hypothetical protein